MNIILFDDPSTRQQLLPFTFTRPIADIRAGILTIRQKWERLLPADYSYLTEEYLCKKYSANHTEDSCYVSGAIFPDDSVVNAIKALKKNEALYYTNQLIALKGKADSVAELSNKAESAHIRRIELHHAPKFLVHVYQIFAENGANIRSDFELITKGRKSQPLTDPHTIVYGKENIFIEENVTIKAAVLNAENGPIYIGANCEIGEMSVIRGNNAICEHSVLGIGTQIRGDTTIGPFCKVGGEISNSVIFGYSSKAHDGFLGSSVIGEWCNMGAGSITSNLKNTYKNIKIWNYPSEGFEDTGRQFCGLIMGDHSKCGINTMFNTGTVVGVSANIFGAGYPRNFIPSFSWGGPQGLVTFKLKDAFEVMTKVMERRGITLTEEDKNLFSHIFDVTSRYRPDSRK